MRSLRASGFALVAVVAALVAVPAANSEQAGSKAKRLPASFLDAGANHTCVILSAGRVRCWGRGLNGQLGYGNMNNIGDDELPGSLGTVSIGTGLRAVAISAGTSHTCAILNTGRVRCWGSSSGGELGYGNTNSIGDDELPSSAGPVDLGTGRTAVAITAGGSHTCVILDTGAVRCWGDGGFGQLGYGDTDTIGNDELPSSVGPVSLGSGRRAVAIAAGDVHTCAILDNGKVRCWGLNSAGQLGYGNTDSVGDDELPSSVGPVELGTGRRAVAIGAGDGHTCALLDNGRVRCWGEGTDGRLGYGNTDEVGDDESPASVDPVHLGAGRRAVAIAVGSGHTCAILDTGAVRCWGDPDNGRLGYGNLDAIGDDELPDAVAPVDIGTGAKAVALSGGGAHTCAVLQTGSVRCWGEGTFGRLGYGNTTMIGDNEAPGSVGPVSAGGLVTRKATPKLSLALKPKRDRRAPYRVKTSGTLSGFLVDPATCSGKIVVKAKQGRKSVVKRPALKRSGRRCTYAASFRIRGPGRWKVTARFAGNGSLRARASRARSFRAG